MMKRIRPRQAAGVTLVILCVVFAFRGRGPGASELPSSAMTRGTFVVDVTESGEVEATHSMSVSSPRVGDWGSRPQIVWLAQEGAQVEEGDPIARFDPSALEKTIFQEEADFEIKKASLTTAQASQLANMAQLEASLRNTKASRELAQLALTQLAFESEVVQREGQLRFEQAENDLAGSRQQIDSQKIIDGEEIHRLELEIRQAHAELEKAREDLASLEVKAPASGLIVYEKNWNTGNKYQVGDTPWPGAPLIGLPDLSEMRVRTQVNEIDVSKVEAGQEVEVRLDAFDGPTFRAHVEDVATLGKKRDDDSDVKVFETLVAIDTTAHMLKPGMTASCTIVVRSVPDVLSMPLDAVFKKDGSTIAYRIDGRRWKAVEVILGARNDNHVVVESGLGDSDRVALLDPTSDAASITPTDLPQKATPSPVADRPSSRPKKGKRTFRRHGG